MSDSIEPAELAGAVPQAPVKATPAWLKTRLAAMMFLQYFVQGCYLPIISVYLKESLGFSGKQLGYVGSALAVGPLMTPFFIGQLVDRKYSTQHVLAVCHALGGIIMLLLFRERAFVPVLILGILYSVLYVPSMMLTNSLAFHHLVDSRREFPMVRLWGTIGFVAPAWLVEFVFLKGLTGESLNQARGVALAAAGIGGLAMALYSLLMLPDTPPAKDVKEANRFAPAIAANLVRHRSVLVLVVISFFAAIVHKFHFVANGPFLTSLLRAGGEEGAWEASISSLGQIAEVGVMAGLAWLVSRLGFRLVITLGLAAYAGRCLMFVWADQVSSQFGLAMTIACLGQAYHGLCFSCFMAASFMFLDRSTPSHVRGTVQNLYGTFVLGLGFLAGGVVAGEVMEYFTESGTGSIKFTGVWLFAATLGAVCSVAFFVAFPKGEPEQLGVDRAEA
ncbi:MAG: MFS transporter [Planctomycetales bacterium]|nr:MFS transporter [Planctomycetales bacterium]